MNEEQGKFLEELYHANFKRMLLELYPILKDMPSAQVAIQEAARIACQKPEEMMSSPNPAGWLRKTAGLVAKNMLREQARQKRTFLPLEVLLPESEPSEWDDSDRELVQLCLDVVSEEDFTLFRRARLVILNAKEQTPRRTTGASSIAFIFLYHKNRKMQEKRG